MALDKLRQTSTAWSHCLSDKSSHLHKLLNSSHFQVVSGSNDSKKEHFCSRELLIFALLHSLDDLKQTEKAKGFLEILKLKKRDSVKNTTEHKQSLFKKLTEALFIVYY